MIFSFFKYRKAQTSSQSSQQIMALPSLFAYRLLGNLLLIAFIASIAVIIVTVRENLINKQVDAVLDQFYALTADYGWKIDDILIQGRDKTSKEDILKQINLSREDNILQVNLKQIKDKVEELPWVRKAAVRRSFFPNVLHISIVEKQIIALWQSENQFYPVDENGRLVEADYTPHKPILILVGTGAYEKINQLLDVISSSEDIIKRVKAAKLYAGRRWDIILDDIDNGITVKLPENNMETAWKKFVKINNQHGLLKRKLTIIDLRYKNKLIVTVDSSAFADEKSQPKR